MTFRTATPTNSLLWDITLDMGADGVISVVCQRKAPIPGKRQVLFLNGCVCQPFLLLNSPTSFRYFYQSMPVEANISSAWGRFAASLKGITNANELEVVCRCASKFTPHLTCFCTLIAAAGIWHSSKWDMLSHVVEKVCWAVFRHTVCNIYPFVGDQL